MQVYVEFLLGGGERGRVENNAVVPLRLKFRIIRSLSHHCTGCYGHATHNIFFFYAQIMELCIYYETSYKTTYYIYCVLHHLKCDNPIICA
jgi:hypothetical protein